MTSFTVVTGAGSGIGRATALVLSPLPSRLVIVGRQRHTLEETAAMIRSHSPGSPSPLVIDADCSNPEDMERMAASLRDIAIGGVVLAAGGTSPRPDGVGLSATATAWTAAFQINVLTAILPTRALNPLFAEQVSVVAVGSIAGSRGGGSYGAAKAALVPWIRDLAADLGPRGGTANVVAPGYVTDTGFFGDAMTPERHERLVSETHTGRPGTPEDVASTIAFLISPGAAHITGQVIHVNGGALLAG